MNDRRGRNEDRLVHRDADDAVNAVNAPPRHSGETAPGTGPRPATPLEDRDGPSDTRTAPPDGLRQGPGRNADDGGYEDSPGRTPPPGDRPEGRNGHPGGDVFGDGVPAAVTGAPRAPRGVPHPDPAHREGRAHRPAPDGLADPAETDPAGTDLSGTGRSSTADPASPESHAGAARPGGGNGGGGLFDRDPEETRRRWQEVQAGFVDNPRDSVERADSLVAEVTGSLLTALENRAAALQDRWRGSERRDTEDLRTDLRDYRALLEELLGLSTGTR